MPSDIEIVQVSSPCKTVLGNIVEVGVYPTPCNPDMIIDYAYATVIGETNPPYPLHIVGLGECIDETTVENKAVIHTVRLTARFTAMLDYIIGANSRFFFRTADGRKYMIGGTGLPYPVAVVTESFPGNSSDQSGYALTVEYKGSHGVLLIAD